MSRRLVKLVRGSVGTLLGDCVVRYERVPPERVVEARLDKLVEEALEFFKRPSIGEAADVLDALTACVADLPGGVTMDDVAHEAAAKREERGGFGEGIGMWVETTAAQRHEGEHGRWGPGVE